MIKDMEFGTSMRYLYRFSDSLMNIKFGFYFYLVLLYILHNIFSVFVAIVLVFSMISTGLSPSNWQTDRTYRGRSAFLDR